MVDRSLRNLISKDASVDELFAAARADGFTTMQESCRDLVLRGITTTEEAARTITSTAD